MSKSDSLAEKKSEQIVSISSELKTSAKEIEVRKKLDEIDKLVARRGSNLRRNHLLKKNVEQKLKEMRRVDHSAVVGSLIDFIDLYIDNDVALKERDKLIEEVVKDLETILNEKDDVKRRSRNFDDGLSQEKFKRRFEESSKTSRGKLMKKFRKSAEISSRNDSKKASSLDSRGLWKSTNRISGRSKRFARTSGISERSRIFSERRLMKDFKKLQKSGTIAENSVKLPNDLQTILENSEKSLKRALDDYHAKSENLTLRRSEERLQRRLEKDENHNQITDKIIKMNILLDKQHELMKVYNKEINETFSKMFPDNSSQTENFAALKSKVQVLRRKIKQKDTILKEKYESLEKSVGEIEDIRNDEERTKGLLGEAENSLEGAMHDEDDGGGSDLTSMLHDEVTNTCGTVVERNSALKTDRDSDLQKIKDLEAEHKDWMLKAHKCKCFYKSWFNKKCKF